MNKFLRKSAMKENRQNRESNRKRMKQKNKQKSLDPLHKIKVDTPNTTGKTSYRENGRGASNRKRDP